MNVLFNDHLTLWQLVFLSENNAHKENDDLKDTFWVHINRKENKQQISASVKRWLHLFVEQLVTFLGNCLSKI